MSTGSHPEAARNKVSLVERPESGDGPSVPPFEGRSVDAFGQPSSVRAAQPVSRQPQHGVSNQGVASLVETAELRRPDCGVHDPRPTASDVLVSQLNVYSVDRVAFGFIADAPRGNLNDLILASETWSTSWTASPMRSR